MLQYFIGRQAIYDHNLKVIGYELLYRPHNVAFLDKIDDEDYATSLVLLNSFIEAGLEELVGPHKAFVNLTRKFILNGDLIPPAKHQLVLEILENIEVDDELVQAVRILKSKGYTIALDDFVYHDAIQPLVELADIIKIDLRALKREELEDYVQHLRPYPAKLLAEKVETYEEFEDCMALGFNYFQGYFLCRPKTLQGTRLVGNRLAVMQMVANLQAPEVDIPDLERIISQDVALTFKLIKYINSAAFSLPRKIDSIRHAIVYLGPQEVKNWASLIALSSIDDKPGELFVTALTRAKMCEMLMTAIDADHKGAAFITGMFSALDAIMDADLTDLLAEMPIAAEIKESLLPPHEGPYSSILQCTLAYERGQWSNVTCPPLDEGTISDSYIQAVKWAVEAGKLIASPDSKAA
ncbi:MAG TPA: HDOD domain-containing protein [Gammaproteobacteria bacterium]|nr:HDOD domain-containing protein [Gammaproteobacteria bacterium]